MSCYDHTCSHGEVGSQPNDHKMGGGGGCNWILSLYFTKDTIKLIKGGSRFNLLSWIKYLYFLLSYQFIPSIYIKSPQCGIRQCVHMFNSHTLLGQVVLLHK